LVRRALAGELDLVVSEQLLSELERALAYPKLRARITAEEAGQYVDALRRSAELVPDASEPPVRSPDPDDDYLVALAAQERVPLVTGDRHLLELAGDLPIYAPDEFLRPPRRSVARRGALGAL